MTPHHRVEGAPFWPLRFRWLAAAAFLLFPAHLAATPGDVPSTGTPGRNIDLRDEQAAVHKAAPRPVESGPAPAAPKVAVGQPRAIRPDVKLHRVAVTAGRDGRTVELTANAGPDPVPCHERDDSVYCNTLGPFAWGPSQANRRIADDLVFAAVPGCSLDRYVIRVTGDKDGDGSGTALGAYTVTAGLYPACRYSTLPPTPIPGTEFEHTVPADRAGDVEHIEFVVPATETVALPGQAYLGMSFSREKCGAVVGAPGLKGFSADLMDLPAAPCNAWFGGFPRFPYASLYAEVYTRESCAPATIAYRNSAHAEGPYSCGVNCRFADDVQLAIPAEGCNLVAYEVAYRGTIIGVELRTALSDADPTGGLIEGTRGTCFPQTLNEIEVCRVDVDPPIPVGGDELWVVYRSGNSTLGPIRTSLNAQIGSTDPCYLVYDTAQARWVPVCGVDRGAGFDLTLYCQGAAPSGACCDTLFVENGVCAGGDNEGTNCAFFGGCRQGTCVGDAVCRDVPELNCPLNRWVEGQTCNADPFDPPCGVYACCKPDDTCENLTVEDCLAVPPVERNRQWQRGLFCGQPDQWCPFNACIQDQGDCSVEHSETGCQDPLCCTEVCEIDNWCCSSEWDELCVREAQENCSRQTPLNDACFDPDPQKGARLVDSNSSTAVAVEDATSDAADPGFCCKADDPGARGYWTVWFRFVATDTTARVHTCNSLPPADDSMIQVFRSGDPSTPETACATLDAIACSDDAPGCGDGRNSDVCVENLVPGETYYVLLATKSEQALGVYRLDIESPCTPTEQHAPNDLCHNAATVSEGATPFDLTGATFDCPRPNCALFMQNEVWYQWTAPRNENVIVDTCDPVCLDGPNRGKACTDDAECAEPGTCSNPDTGLAVYAGCDCPPDDGRLVACNEFDFAPCLGGSRVTFDVTEGQCYLLRLSGNDGSLPAGHLRITERFCHEGEVQFLDPVSGTIDARQPHPAIIPFPPQGIRTIATRAPPGAEVDLHPSTIRAIPLCWEFCESGSGPIDIFRSTARNADDSVTLRLTRTVTPDTVAALVYEDYLGNATTGVFVNHPANVDGNEVADAGDVRAMIDCCLQGDCDPAAMPPEQMPYRCDVDHSDTIAPADLLRLVDLLGGAELYEPGWNGTPLPTDEGECVQPP